MPRHVGIILDGNRRHASRHGVADLRTIYEVGARKLDDVLSWCDELCIPAITLWVLSSDNLRRPAKEVSAILGAIEAKLTALAKHPAASIGTSGTTESQKREFRRIGRRGTTPLWSLGPTHRWSPRLTHGKPGAIWHITRDRKDCYFK